MASKNNEDDQNMENQRQIQSIFNFDLTDLRMDDENEDSVTDDQILQYLRDLSDLPASLIISNITNRLFQDNDIKDCFEQMFKVFDTQATFQYFRNFRRCRINFSTPNAATLAKLSCHKAPFHGCPINCFFAQPLDPENKSENENGGDRFHLKLPKLEKQFLISPPASPPAGWEQCSEQAPLTLPPPSPTELFNRLAALAINESNDQKAYVLYSNEDSQSTSSKPPRPINNPKIIVHGCLGNNNGKDESSILEKMDLSEDNDDESSACSNPIGRPYKFSRTPRPEYYGVS